MLQDLTLRDMVTVTHIDRLARPTFDLSSIVKRIVDAGGQFWSLTEPWADSSTSTGRLMLADVERELIKTRTAEAGAAPRAGAAYGPPTGSDAQQAAEARQRRQDGATLQKLADSYTSVRRRFPGCGS